MEKMTFEEKRLRAYEAGTISGNQAYMLSTKEEFLWSKAESLNWNEETQTACAAMLAEWMGNKEYIQEKGDEIFFLNLSEAKAILKQYEDEINEIAEANQL